MTDLSNIPTGQLEQMRASNDRTLAAYKASGTRLEAGNAEIDAEIERRKAEPDYAAWEPKWQAFRDDLGISYGSYNRHERKDVIRALIAAHNTPLAGEDEGWTMWEHGMPVPVEVSSEAYEIEIKDFKGNWQEYRYQPSWACLEYRYRLKQTDEVRP